MARLDPVCSKDGVTNFYSPCQAGCTAKTTYNPPPNPYKPASAQNLDPVTVYQDCSCVATAWRETNLSLSREWVQRDHMAGWDHPAPSVVDVFAGRVEDEPISEAVAGWCDVDCEAVFKTFKLCIFIIMVLGSTGRIGNVLVALR